MSSTGSSSWLRATSGTDAAPYRGDLGQASERGAAHRLVSGWLQARTKPGGALAARPEMQPRNRLVRKSDGGKSFQNPERIRASCLGPGGLRCWPGSLSFPARGRAGGP